MFIIAIIENSQVCVMKHGPHRFNAKLDLTPQPAITVSPFDFSEEQDRILNY